MLGPFSTFFLYVFQLCSCSSTYIAVHKLLCIRHPCDSLMNSDITSKCAAVHSTFLLSFFFFLLTVWQTWISLRHPLSISFSIILTKKRAMLYVDVHRGNVRTLPGHEKITFRPAIRRLSYQSGTKFSLPTLSDVDYVCAWMWPMSLTVTRLLAYFAGKLKRAVFFAVRKYKLLSV